MAKVSNKLRGNGHWTSAYMPLQENLGGEVGKGVLTRSYFFNRKKHMYPHILGGFVVQTHGTFGRCGISCISDA
jgi:hypothetical protein